MTLREHIAIARRRPRDYARYAYLCFRRWTALPGDVFEDFQANTYYVVTDVTPTAVQAIAISGEFLGRTDLHGAIPTYVWIPRRFEPTRMWVYLNRLTLPCPEKARQVLALV